MVRSIFGTCVKFGPTQLPVGLGLRLGLGLGLRLGLGLGLGLGLRLELGLGLGLGPNLIDRKLGGPEPDTSAVYLIHRDKSYIYGVIILH